MSDSMLNLALPKDWKLAPESTRDHLKFRDTASVRSVLDLSTSFTADDERFWTQSIKYVGTTCRRIHGRWWWPFGGQEWEIIHHFEFHPSSKA
jgi:hypothetical protein